MNVTNISGTVTYKFLGKYYYIFSIYAFWTSQPDKTPITFLVSDWYYQSLGVINIDFVKKVKKPLFVQPLLVIFVTHLWRKVIIKIPSLRQWFSLAFPSANNESNRILKYFNQIPECETVTTYHHDFLDPLAPFL